MKRKFPVFLILLLLSGAFLFTACKDKAPTVGNLTVTARTTNATIVANTGIFLATSKDNLDNQVNIIYGTLNSTGSFQFRDLIPQYYYYRVQGYSDIGASEVFAGVDESVIIYLNSPSSSKK